MSGEERGTSDEFLGLDPIPSLLASTFLRHVELHDSLPSTNDRALELTADAALKTPALIIARKQTAGRGRGQHTWWSADGALTLSLILNTSVWGIAQRDWPRLSLTTAVAICDAIAGELPEQGINADIKIKWPNDILIRGRKVCGILIESPGGPPPAKDRLVIGIGMNVNNSWRADGGEAGALGTAMCNVSGRQHDLQTLLIELLRTLNTRFCELGNDALELPQTWQRRCSLTGRTVHIETGGKHLNGQCVGLSRDGELIIETAEGKRSICTGSVQLVV